jgi:rod shape-determining protein MreC
MPGFINDKVRRVLVGTLLFGGTVLLLWLLTNIFGFGRLYSGFQSQVVKSSTGLNAFVTRFGRKGATVEGLFLTCRDDLMTLAFDKAELLQLQRENMELKESLAYKQTHTAVAVTAAVIARSVVDDQTKVIIDQGSKAGVVPGAAVIIGDGYLFGIVTDVGPVSSTVRLLNSAQSRVPATVLGSARTLGLVEGRQGALLVMEFIPQEVNIQLNDLVVTSGLDGELQQNLVIGIVSDIKEVESEPFKRAFVELVYEPRDWTMVQVLIPEPL